MGDLEPGRYQLRLDVEVLEDGRMVFAPEPAVVRYADGPEDVVTASIPEPVIFRGWESTTGATGRVEIHGTIDGGDHDRG